MRTGPARTGGLIAAAAVILAVVMTAIGTSRVANTKMLGPGIAPAVLMDAMVVRSLLVPAVTKLTGRATCPGPAAPAARADRTGRRGGRGPGHRPGPRHGRGR
ncbi:hypothetical protein GCM10010371_59510 [Streptomyces subrutilus]|uniref:Membrane transport protein MMPL domain-containing protein n=1 Tax=Streptomyces subrutilus TaxID=36818 RepID=A0A918VEB4_9ACTN|nr:hypothetical protein GCM10010371_59510 [Streptomyces subrutilus]